MKFTTIIATSLLASTQAAMTKDQAIEFAETFAQGLLGKSQPASLRPCLGEIHAVANGAE